MRRMKEWTYKEIEQLKQLRHSGHTVKDCARILDRPRFSVRQQLHRSKIVVQPKKPLPQQIKKLVSRGKTDAFIALKLGITVDSVRYHRKKMGLRANQQRNKKHRARCFGCNRIAPLTISKGWAELAGWTTKLMRDYGNETIAFCPECPSEF